MENTLVNLRQAVLLYAQRALVGEIDPCFKAISVEIAEDVVKFFVFTDGTHNDDIVEDFDAMVMTQMVSDFPDFDTRDPKMDFEFIAEEEPLSAKGVLIYAKKGVLFS